nr:unnamed protein product [Digitaria exilis]
MAGGASVTPAAGARDYAGGLTFSVMTTCLMAASCGLIWGYDSGVSAAERSILCLSPDYAIR